MWRGLLAACEQPPPGTAHASTLASRRQSECGQGDKDDVDMGDAGGSGALLQITRGLDELCAEVSRGRKTGKEERGNRSRRRCRAPCLLTVINLYSSTLILFSSHSLKMHS